MSLRIGFWTPTSGGWLRNVDMETERTPATFSHVKEIVQAAEELGFDLTLVPEVNLNDVRGFRGPVLDAWELSAAIAAVTSRLEIMAAVRPGFHHPAQAAKAAATIDDISGGRFSLNVVSAWWEAEARQYGGIFSAHDERYDRTEEWVEVVDGLWRQTPFSYSGRFYQLEGTYLEPKPQVLPRFYAGGESEAGRAAISRFADAYLMHGGTPEELSAKIADMRERRLAADRPPLESFGMAAYVIVRDTEEEALAELDRITDVRSGPAYDSYLEFVGKSELDTRVGLRDYSVTNRGLRPNLVGTPDQVAQRILEFERIGVDVLLLQFSPQLEEMKRFARDVFPLLEHLRPAQDATPAHATTQHATTSGRKPSHV
ncbi:LLM class flavin-dependent oxidoreductase [Arthrobacter ginkgonis]|uniref:LLM class flavin-dependent oxidoreductase n=1 Tax=Arthrobacter ginkgonis TaxID=1630594 RepID=A0ABP7C7F9_9MICC